MLEARICHFPVFSLRLLAKALKKFSIIEAQIKQQQQQLLLHLFQA
jgi:hypothetical protein